MRCCWFCVFETPSLITSLDVLTACICSLSPDDVFTFPTESAGLSLDSMRPSPVSPVSCNTDISFATHQCAPFAAAPKKVILVRYVGWDVIYSTRRIKESGSAQISLTRGLEVFVDTSFVENWDKKDAQTGDRDTAISRHGYIILYYGCPLIWKSQLQTEIALSSTESEYTGLSYVLHKAIPLLSLLDELKEQGFPVDKTKQ